MRDRRRRCLAALFCGAMACGPAQAQTQVQTQVQTQAVQPAPATASPVRPPMPAWQTDARQCAWHWREGGGLGLWAESCALSTGRWEVVWDGPLAAFVLRHEGRIQATAVQSWALPLGQGKDASSPASTRALTRAMTRALQQAGALAPQAPCQWQSIAPRPARRTLAFRALVPRDPQALAPTPLGEVPEPVCGPYGVSTHGVRYFMFDRRWPARAVFVDEGQERPMFDPASIVVLR